MLRNLSFSFILLSVICLSACKSNTATSGSKDVLKGHWYKRYTGTVAGYPVVVNMFCNGDNNAGGTYYYTGKSELLTLAFSNDTANAGHIHATESVITDRGNDEADEDSKSVNTWDITVEGNHITGKFHKGNGATTADIDLKEDYTDAYRLTFGEYSDSTKVKGAKWTAAATASCVGVLPGEGINGKDAAFISQSLLKFADADSVHMNSIKDYPKMSVDMYLAGFRADMEEMQKDTTESEPMQDYEQDLSIVPVYNAHNILVVGNSYYSYSGGAHGNHGTYYLNMDVKEQKELTLGDIIQVDSTMLTTLLNAEARTKFNIPAGNAMDETLLVTNIPATDNIIIADRGITFCYNPYEVASYADGEVLLFIPYTKLKSLLKPGFVARMGLKL